MSKKTIAMNLELDMFKANLTTKEVTIIYGTECQYMIMDSQEEIHFLHWLKEAYDLGFIDADISMQVTYDLSESVSNSKPNPGPKSPNRVKKVHLLSEHVYTPDFNFSMKTVHHKGEFIPKLHLYHKDGGAFKKGGIYGNALNAWNQLAIVDTKGGHDNNSRATAINQKWLWQKYRLMVTICKMSKEFFYAQYWAPESMFTTAKGNASAVCQYCVRKEDIAEAMESGEAIIELNNKRKRLADEAKLAKKTRKPRKKPIRRRF